MMSSGLAETPSAERAMKGKMARNALPSGRASVSLVHEDHVRAVLMGLTAGTGLAEHDPPDGATLHIVSGRARLFVAGEGGREWLLEDGDHVAIPHARHGVDAVSDTVLLLTVALAG